MSFLPSGSMPSGFAPGGFDPPGADPTGFNPGGFAPASFDPSGFLPDQPEEPSGPLPLFPLALAEYLTSILGFQAWADVIPQRVANAYPQVVFTLISEEPYYTLLHVAGLVHADYQIDVYADDVQVRATTRETIRLALSGYRGVMNGVPVSSSRLLESVGTAEKASNGSDRWIYRNESTWRFFYQEDLPSSS